MRFENSGFEIDDLYQLVLWSAIPLGADLLNLPASPAYRLFSDAQFELAQAQKGSNRDPAITYHACRATPSDWYTEASAQHWPTLSLNAQDIPQAPPESPFIRLGGRQLVDRGVLQLVPAATNLGAIKQRLQLQMTRPRPLEALKRSRPRPAVARLSGLDQVDINPDTFELVARPKVTFDKKLLLHKYLGEQLVPSKVSSTQFSISFKYCLVTITRGWLKQALLNLRTWYSAGVAQGEYSNGTFTNNPGMFPLVQTSLLAIRDLRIRAVWSKADRDQLVRTRYFGPFDVSASTFKQDTLQADGLQVVGWMSRLNPVLPPLSPPPSP